MYSIDGFLTQPFYSQKCLQSNLTKKIQINKSFLYTDDVKARSTRLSLISSCRVYEISGQEIEKAKSCLCSTEFSFRFLLKQSSTVYQISQFKPWFMALSDNPGTTLQDLGLCLKCINPVCFERISCHQHPIPG